MKRGKFLPQDITILNEHTSNRAFNNMRRKRIELHGQICESTISYILQHLSPQNRFFSAGRKSIHTELNNTIIQLHTIIIYKLLHPMEEYTFFSTSHTIIHQIDHILGKQRNHIIHPFRPT